MKKYQLNLRAEVEGGETVLGAKDLGTHGCYLIYGTLRGGEKPRRFRAGKGHEEILCVVSGALLLTKEGVTLEVTSGEAVHLRGEDTYQGEAVGEICVYVAAGGHMEGADHHH